MSQLVIGLGEVGRGLVEVLGCEGRDKEWGEMLLKRPDVLHVAFPWSESFVSEVQRYQRFYQASLVIVHSTIPVGTCDQYGWVHSPVRGRHPHLADGLRTFVKWFGGAKAIEASRIWPGPSQVTERAAELEAAKLWELAQFGLQVRITQAIYEWCESQGLDPEVVYRQAAETYNQGYQKLGQEQFSRPVLDYQHGDIGGHCITPSAELLDHLITDLVVTGF